MANEFIKCETCGSLFNPAFLDQVAEHEHSRISIPVMAKGKKVISHAREVYFHCSGEFASGVHLYLNGEPMPKRPCDDHLIQGWMCAERDLKQDYILQK